MGGEKFPQGAPHGVGRKTGQLTRKPGSSVQIYIYIFFSL